MNTLTRNRGSLPLTRKRKGMAGFTGPCVFEGLVYQTTEVEASVETGAQCILAPLLAYSSILIFVVISEC